MNKERLGKIFRYTSDGRLVREYYCKKRDRRKIEKEMKLRRQCEINNRSLRSFNRTRKKIEVPVKMERIRYKKSFWKPGYKETFIARKEQSIGESYFNKIERDDMMRVVMTRIEKFCTDILTDKQMDIWKRYIRYKIEGNENVCNMIAKDIKISVGSIGQAIAVVNKKIRDDVFCNQNYKWSDIRNMLRAG